MALRKTKEKPVAKLDDDALRTRKTKLEADHAAWVAAPVPGIGLPLTEAQPLRKASLEEGKRLVTELSEVESELRSRTFRDREVLARDAKSLPGAPARAALEALGKSPPPEIQGATFSPSRLTPEEGAELGALVAKRRAGDLSDAERTRFEALVEQAAADPGLFERVRRDRVAKERLGEISRQRRRHPEASSVVAAIMGDENLFDYLHSGRLREVQEIDQWGNARPITTSEAVLELDHISVLFTLANAIAANGGHPVEVNEHGVVKEVASGGGRLPFLPKRLGRLQMNGYLTVERSASGHVVGFGPRVHKLAARWELELPEPDAASREVATASA